MPNHDVFGTGVSLKFTFGEALNGEHYRDIVLRNPFRVLGVWADASEREIKAAATKIKRYLEIGRQPSGLRDFSKKPQGDTATGTGMLPPLERTPEMVDKALADLNRPEDRLRFSMFWLLAPRIDEEEKVYKLLEQGIITDCNIGRTFDYDLSDLFRFNLNTVLQIAVSSNPDINSMLYAVNSLLTSQAELFWSNWVEYTRRVCGSDFKFSLLQFKELYLDGLMTAVRPVYLWRLVKEHPLFSKNEATVEYLYEKSVGRNIRHINTEIAKAQSVDSHDSAKSRAAALALKTATEDDIKTVKAELGEDDVRRQLAADALGTRILQSAINYYNASAERETVARETLSLMVYAKTIAEGESVLKRCQESIDVVQQMVDTLPPLAVMTPVTVLRRMCADYRKRPATIDNAMAFLHAAAPYIISIKQTREEVIDGGTKDRIFDALVSISTDIAAICLNNCVEEVNRQEEDNPFTMYHKAWNVIGILDQLSLDMEFEIDRYKPNRDILWRNISSRFGTRGFAPTPYYSIVNLCTETEIWNQCTNKQDYSLYIRLYPSGKYIHKARAQQAKIEEEEAERRRQKEERRRLQAAKIAAQAKQQRKYRKEENDKSVLNWIIFACVVLIIFNIIYLIWGWTGVAYTLGGIVGLFLLGLLVAASNCL